MRFIVALYLLTGSSEESETEYCKKEEREDDADTQMIQNDNGMADSMVDDEAAFKIQFKSLLPHEIELRNAGAEGVWSTASIPCGTKYGPYIGKWLPKPIDTRFAWEVSVYSLIRCRFWFFFFFFAVISIRSDVTRESTNLSRLLPTYTRRFTL